MSLCFVWIAPVTAPRALCVCQAWTMINTTLRDIIKNYYMLVVGFFLILSRSAEVKFWLGFNFVFFRAIMCLYCMNHDQYKDHHWDIMKNYYMLVVGVFLSWFCSDQLMWNFGLDLSLAKCHAKLELLFNCCLYRIGLDLSKGHFGHCVWFTNSCELEGQLWCQNYDIAIMKLLLSRSLVVCRQYFSPKNRFVQIKFSIT